jgi:hypothetical protein
MNRRTEDPRIRLQAVLDAAVAFDVDPQIVIHALALRRTARKDLCKRVERGDLEILEALKMACDDERRPRRRKIARKPKSPQGKFSF